jgi:hypothetical protein
MTRTIFTTSTKVIVPNLELFDWYLIGAGLTLCAVLIVLKTTSRPAPKKWHGKLQVIDTVVIVTVIWPLVLFVLILGLIFNPTGKMR